MGLRRLSMARIRVRWAIRSRRLRLRRSGFMVLGCDDTNFGLRSFSSLSFMIKCLFFHISPSCHILGPHNRTFDHQEWCRPGLLHGLPWISATILSIVRIPGSGSSYLDARSGKHTERGKYVFILFTSLLELGCSEGIFRQVWQITGGMSSHLQALSSYRLYHSSRSENGNESSRARFFYTLVSSCCSFPPGKACMYVG